MSGQESKNVGSDYQEPIRNNKNTPSENKRNSLLDKAREAVSVFSCLKEVSIPDQEKIQLTRQCAQEDVEWGVRHFLKAVKIHGQGHFKSIGGWIRRAGQKNSRANSQDQ